MNDKHESAGDRPAFPNFVYANLGGMSYRQWLIGMVAGPLTRDWSHPDSRYADDAVGYADAIIARLDETGPHDADRK